MSDIEKLAMKVMEAVSGALVALDRRLTDRERDAKALRRMGDIHHERLLRLEAFLAPEMDAAGVEQIGEVTASLLLSALKNEPVTIERHLDEQVRRGVTDFINHLVVDHQADRRDLKVASSVTSSDGLVVLHSRLHNYEVQG